MNSDSLRTKPAVKSSTVWAAVLTILGVAVELATSYQGDGVISSAELAIAIPVVVAQVRIISERLKERRAPIKGVV